jgi:hypothetical protein
MSRDLVLDFQTLTKLTKKVTMSHHTVRHSITGKTRGPQKRYRRTACGSGFGTTDLGSYRYSNLLDKNAKRPSHLHVQRNLLNENAKRPSHLNVRRNLLDENAKRPSHLNVRRNLLNENAKRPSHLNVQRPKDDFQRVCGRLSINTSLRETSRPQKGAIS